MSISRQNLTVIIVTFKSENVIHDCIQSIGSDIQILIIDNSNNLKFKDDLEKRYKNVRCILSDKNLGMGAGNNLGIKNVTSDYAFVLNPDVILEKDTIDEIIMESRKIESFAVIAPIEIDKNFPNYKLGKDVRNHPDGPSPFNVKSVDGYAMILNLKKLNSIDKFDYFDENFFMYLENDDLCRRIINLNEKIFVIPKSKIKHLGGKAVNKIYEYEIELSRNWHWIWSKFYFKKKYYGYFFAVLSGLPNFFSSIFKFVIYFLINNKKNKIYMNRVLGFINGLLLKNSHYRPKIND